jgi:hypothetical protein
MEKRPFARKGPKTSIPYTKFIKEPGVWHGPENMEKGPWPRRAAKRRFHTGNLSRNQGGVARPQKHGKAPLATNGKAAKTWKSAPGHEGPQNFASTQEIYQGTRGAWQGTKNMEKGALATKGPKMSLPHKEFSKKPGGRGSAPQT